VRNKTLDFVRLFVYALERLQLEISFSGVISCSLILDLSVCCLYFTQNKNNYTNIPFQPHTPSFVVVGTVIHNGSEISSRIFSVTLQE